MLARVLNRSTVRASALFFAVFVPVAGCAAKESPSEAYTLNRPGPQIEPYEEEYQASEYETVEGEQAPVEHAEAKMYEFEDDSVDGELAAPAPPSKSEQFLAPESDSAAVARGHRAQRRRPRRFQASKKAKRSAGSAYVSPPVYNTEGYQPVEDNDFVAVVDKALSTFSVDVDTASYANVRRFLSGGQLPPPDAVRTEEMINYFSYEYGQPHGQQPFSVTTEVADCPWNPDARLVHIGLQGKELDRDRTPRRNLVFLLDVSGSMNSHDKLPLLKRSLKMLTRQLTPKDRVAIVVYAGASGVVLPPTSDPYQIEDALNRLQAGGSTNGGQGIELAYNLAQRSFIRGGINRVILATDGDFNVGTTSRGALTRLIEAKRKSGIFLTVLGFGTGNVKDDTMEMLADKGNGNYAYIDSLQEARKVLVEEAGSTLVTIAKDVKIQVEFNPAMVSEYRLVGYENRKMANRDFNDDTKDAGEIGAGHTVTALYEVIPSRRGRSAAGDTDALRYQEQPRLSRSANSGELLYLKLRYKTPQGRRSKLSTYTVRDRGYSLRGSSDNFRFSAAVAQFSLLLRDSKYRGRATFEQTYELAHSALGVDYRGYRREFLQLIDQAAELKAGRQSLSRRRARQHQW